MLFDEQELFQANSRVVLFRWMEGVANVKAVMKLLT